MTPRPVPSSYTAALVPTKAYSKISHSTYPPAQPVDASCSSSIFTGCGRHRCCCRARGRWRAIGV
ncbi:hypothetical protein FIBSPDRAFT_848480 [Athelia psychrophila]|uniref:Uncharacterized protein n=1 Tax=Athelia psychrophila TaxID=1759441 RepID=A0A166VG89_9AGAM|nr:hypothetical protein FIBSPDRAFT_848480 [Fibularhizoctonia sp. CBS 109695]